MGLTFSKSIRFGLVRFNLSGSGIGISAGIPGLRIGTGPRGAYISGGRGGFRYRQSLGSTRRPRIAPEHSNVPNQPQHEVQSTGAVMHDAMSVLQLSDADADDLVRSMNEQRKKVDWWPFVAFGLAAGLWQLYSTFPTWPTWLKVGLAFLAIAATVFVWWRDRIRKLTVLFFDLDEHAEQRFTALREAVIAAGRAARLQSINTTSQYRDTRYTAGAAQGLKFGPAAAMCGQPAGMQTNIEVPMLRGARTTLAFFPDRVLALQGSDVGAIEYSQLNAEAVSTRFVEESAVPPDATVVGHTWKFVNRDGSPDRRFNGNRQIPLCAYNQLNLSNAAGFDLRFMASKQGCFDGLAKSLSSMRL